MKLLRYGRKDDDLLMELDCACAERFSFVAKVKDHKVEDDTIHCPGCKQTTSVSQVIKPQEFYSFMQQEKNKNEQPPTPPAPAGLAPFTLDLSCPDCGFSLPIVGQAPPGSKFAVTAFCDCEAMQQIRSIRWNWNGQAWIGSDRTKKAP